MDYADSVPFQYMKHLHGYLPGGRVDAFMNCANTASIASCPFFSRNLVINRDSVLLVWHKPNCIGKFCYSVEILSKDTKKQLENLGMLIGEPTATCKSSDSFEESVSIVADQQTDELGEQQV
jgi:hypothetical protein